jgi:hypothetical protein
VPIAGEFISGCDAGEAGSDHGDSHRSGCPAATAKRGAGRENVKDEGAAGDEITGGLDKGCYNLWVLLVAHGSFGSHGRQSNRKAFCFQGNGSIGRWLEGEAF